MEIRGRLANQGKLLIERSLIVSGTVENTGEMRLNAPLTTTNPVINRGRLILNAPLHTPEVVSLGGSITAQDLVVGPAQQLLGDVTVEGNLINQGTLSPGQASGKIEVTGNYTQSGMLRAEILNGGAGGFDRLAVGGQAQLGGKLKVSLLPGATFGAGAVFEILQAESILGTVRDARSANRGGDTSVFCRVWTGLCPVDRRASRAAAAFDDNSPAGPGQYQDRRPAIDYSQAFWTGVLSVEFSTDLRHWVAEAVLPSGNSRIDYLGYQATNNPAGFYRVILLPKP